jgi:hypothetical protein
MRRHSQYFVGCAGAAFALACFVLALEISSITAAPSAEQVGITFNRTLKGDRLPSAPAVSRNAVNGPSEIKAPPQPASQSELLMGCEPVISQIGRSPLARVAGRCLS